MAEYDELVAKLTREHHTTVHTDDGPRFIKVSGLLQQLRDEVFGGSNVGGAPANQTKLPLNAPALDLYEQMDRQIAEVWADAFNQIPNADRPERLAAQWSAKVSELEMVDVKSPHTDRVWSDRYGEDVETVVWRRTRCTAINLLRRWVHEIEDLFNPPRTAEIMAACIQCGERKIRRPKDGHMVFQSALVFVRNRETGESQSARCQSCGCEWVPAQFLYLAETIATNEALAWWQDSTRDESALRLYAKEHRLDVEAAREYLVRHGVDVARHAVSTAVDE